MEELGAPESWEVADLDDSMNRLMLSSKKDSKPPQELCDGSVSASAYSSSSSSASSASNLAGGEGGGGERISEDLVNQVDQFLREALQNPRERLSSKLFVHFSMQFLYFYAYLYAYVYVYVNVEVYAYLYLYY